MPLNVVFQETLILFWQNDEYKHPGLGTDLDTRVNGIKIILSSLFEKGRYLVLNRYEVSLKSKQLTVYVFMLTQYTVGHSVPLLAITIVLTGQWRMIADNSGKISVRASTLVAYNNLNR